MKRNRKDAFNDPEVPKKLEQLVQDWQTLSMWERVERVLELQNINCPRTAIAERLGCSESTLRYWISKYKRPSSPLDKVMNLGYPEDDDRERKRSLPAREENPVVLVQNVAPHSATLSAVNPGPGAHPVQTAPAPQVTTVVTRDIEDVKAAVRNFLDERYQVHTGLRMVELVKGRCSELEYCGQKPRPAMPNALPADVIAQCDPRNPRLEDFESTIQQLSVAVLKLLPREPDREAMLSELLQAYTNLVWRR